MGFEILALNIFHAHDVIIIGCDPVYVFSFPYVYGGRRHTVSDRRVTIVTGTREWSVNTNSPPSRNTARACTRTARERKSLAVSAARPAAVRDYYLLRGLSNERTRPSAVRVRGVRGSQYNICARIRTKYVSSALLLLRAKSRRGLPVEGGRVLKGGKRNVFLSTNTHRACSLISRRTC